MFHSLALNASDIKCMWHSARVNWLAETDSGDRLGKRARKGKDKLINKDFEFISTRLAAHCSMLRDNDFLEVLSNSSLELEIAVKVLSTLG